MSFSIDDGSASEADGEVRFPLFITGDSIESVLVARRDPMTGDLGNFSSLDPQTGLEVTYRISSQSQAGVFDFPASRHLALMLQTQLALDEEANFFNYQFATSSNDSLPNSVGWIDPSQYSVSLDDFWQTISIQNIGPDSPWGAPWYLSVPTFNDRLPEGDESFNIEVSIRTASDIVVLEPDSIASGHQFATGTIEDDDPIPVFTIEDVEVHEEEGFLEVPISMSFNEELLDGYDVEYTIPVVLRSGSATAEDIFAPRISGDSWTAPIGTPFQFEGKATLSRSQPSRVFRIPIINDTDEEPSEFFTITLSNPLTVSALGIEEGGGIAQFGQQTGTMTILDSDDGSVVTPDEYPIDVLMTNTSPPDSSYSAPAPTEPPQTEPAPTAPAPTEPIPTAPIPTTPAPAQPAPTPSPGPIPTPTQPIPTSPLPTPTPIQPTPSPSPTLPNPIVSIGAASAAENAGMISFPITVTNPGTANIVVNYSTSDGSATSPFDYTGGSGSLTIYAGSTTGIISIPVIDDSADEENQSFTISISLAAGSSASLSNAAAIGTIADNDDDQTTNFVAESFQSLITPPSISVLAMTVSEADGSFVVPVFLSNSSRSPVSFKLTTVNLSATAGSDYAAASSIWVTIRANSTSASYSLAIYQDSLGEGPEAFLITLSDPTGATIGTSQNVITILDDETIVSVANATGGEGADNGDKVQFTITRIGPTNSGSITVSYAASIENGNTAIAADLGSTLTGSVTIADGASTATVDVFVTDDLLPEGYETFTFTLTSAAGAHLSPMERSSTGTVADDDFSISTIIDVDLDGDGYADAVFDDEVLYLGVNNDDDDGDAIADLDNPGTLAVADDELLLVRLTIVTDGNFTGYSLTASGDNVRVWTDARKSTLVSTESPLDLNANGSQTVVVELYVEGLAEGEGTVTFGLAHPSNTIGNGPEETILGDFVFVLLHPQRAAWISRLQAEKLKHRKYLYYEPSGIKALFKTLEAQSKSLTFAPQLNPWAKAAYQSVSNTVLVNSIGDTPELTAVHETVHAVDDKNDWYLTFWTTYDELVKAESLAYAAEAILNNTAQLQDFENRLRDGRLSPENTLNEWTGALNYVNTILQTPVVVAGCPNKDQIHHNVNAADLADVKVKLGVSLDFSVLMPMYQQLLTQKGINVTLSMDVGSVHLAQPFRGN